MNKIWEFIKNASQSRTTALLVILVIGASIPLTVLVAQRQQSTQQHASQTAVDCSRLGQYYCSGTGGICTVMQDPNNVGSCIEYCDACTNGATCQMVNSTSPACIAPTSQPTTPPAATAPPSSTGGASCTVTANPTTVNSGGTTTLYITTQNTGNLGSCRLIDQNGAIQDPTNLKPFTNPPSWTISNITQTRVFSLQCPVGTTLCSSGPITVNSTGTGTGTGTGTTTQSGNPCNSAGQCTCKKADGTTENSSVNLSGCQAPYSWICDPTKGTICSSANATTTGGGTTGNCSMGTVSCQIPGNNTCFSITGNSCSCFQGQTLVACGTNSGTTAPPAATTGNGNVAFLIGLDGIGSAGDFKNQLANSLSNKNLASSATNKNFTITLTDLNKSAITSVTAAGAYDSSSGSYKGTASLSIPSTGGYVMAQVPGHLRKIIMTIAAGQTTFTMSSPINLIAGDMDGNNLLQPNDYSIFLSCSIFNKDGGSACGSHQSDADFNGDGKVDQLDYNIFLREYAAAQGD